MAGWPARIERPQYNKIINDFMSDNNLHDIWKEINPNVKNFTWYKPNGTCTSRLDYWLASKDILCHTTKTVSKAPLSDNCFIDLMLEPSRRQTYQKGFWKFKAKLLENENFCIKVKELINESKSLILS